MKLPRWRTTIGVSHLGIKHVVDGGEDPGSGADCVLFGDSKQVVVGDARKLAVDGERVLVLPPPNCRIAVGEVDSRQVVGWRKVPDAVLLLLARWRGLAGDLRFRASAMASGVSSFLGSRSSIHRSLPRMRQAWTNEPRVAPSPLSR